VSGSAGDREGGLRLVVPAITLLVPTILLIVGLLALPRPVPEPVSLELVVPAEPEIVVALPPAEDLAIVVDTPTSEPATPSVEATVVPTPLPSTPLAIATPRATATTKTSWMGPSTFTFVALGVDQRTEDEIPRTDTIMIGRVDLRAGRVNLVSIPRDLLVDIPDYGKDRINSAYVYGEQYKEPGGGIGLLKRTILKNFGFQIDHFGLVDFQCFRTAVDAVGGVTVNVPRPIEDTHYPTDDYGTKVVKFETGVQRMDGERALEYARTRYSDSDFHRMERQQLIIAAMREQLLQLRTLPSLPTLLSGCRNMRSDLGWRDYLTLGTTMQSFSGSRVSFATIDERMTTDAVLDSGAAVLLPRWLPIHALLAETFGSAAIDPTSVAGSVALPSPTPSPTPTRPLASPSPYPSPFPRDPTVAYPVPPDVLPGDASLIPPVSGQPVRRT